MAIGKKFSVSIIGGGIGGLAFAVALSKFPDIDVTIYEAAAVFSEVGAGVGVWPRIWRTLAKLGLAEDLRKVTHLEPREGLTDTFQFRRSDVPEGINFYKLQTTGNFLTYHRPDFQQVLIDNLPPTVKIFYKKRLDSYSQSQNGDGPVTITFLDGTTATCDLLVGADGIKSAVRRCFLNELADRAETPEEAAELRGAIEPRWTGIVAYRNLIPVERLNAYADSHQGMKVRVPQSNSIPHMYMGDNINVVVYPISSGKLINVAAFHANESLAGTKFPGQWVASVEKDDLIAAHNHWEPELRAILDCVEKPSRWAIHASVPLKTWNSGHVTLLGDAAHAMSPQQASGGGQAIEDAFVLATLLGHHLTTKSNIRRALSIYDAIRRPMASLVAEKSLLQGRYYGLQLPGVDLRKEPHRLHEVGEAIYDNWSWTWKTTLDPYVKEAVRRLESGKDYSNAEQEATLLVQKWQNIDHRELTNTMGSMEMDV